jgi:hypothetical protein
VEHSQPHLCLCVADANKKKRLTRSRLPPRVKKLVANLKESGTPTAALGTERGLAIEDGSADVSSFVRALR